MSIMDERASSRSAAEDPPLRSRSVQLLETAHASAGDLALFTKLFKS